jgi:hypothetical protein
LVTYNFFNLCYRNGDMSHPKPIPCAPFVARIPLAITGHVFKRGWTVRLSISPFLFPTLWQSVEVPTLKLRTGARSKLSLPVRAPRREDADVQKLLVPTTEYVNPKQYVSTTEHRPASGTRTAEPVVVGGKNGILVKKVFDSGNTTLGGALENLSVDQVITEEIQILEGEPVSLSFSGSTESTFSRGSWKARSVTHSRLWSEKINSGEVVFKYQASAQAFDGDRLLAENRVERTIPRQWI